MNKSQKQSKKLKILLLQSQQFPPQNGEYSKMISKYLLSNERYLINQIVYTFEQEKKEIQIWNCNAYSLPKCVIKFGCANKDIVIVIGQVGHHKTKRKMRKLSESMYKEQKIKNGGILTIGKAHNKGCQQVGEKLQKLHQHLQFGRGSAEYNIHINYANINHGGHTHVYNLESQNSQRQQNYLQTDPNKFLPQQNVKDKKVFTDAQLSQMIRKVNPNCVIACLYIGLPKSKFKENQNISMDLLKKTMNQCEQEMQKNLKQANNLISKIDCIETVFPVADKYLQFLIPFAVQSSQINENTISSNENMIRIIQQLSFYYNNSTLSKQTTDTQNNRSTKINPLSTFSKKGRKSNDKQNVDTHETKQTISYPLITDKSIQSPQKVRQANNLNKTLKNIEKHKDDDCFLMSFFCGPKIKKKSFETKNTMTPMITNSFTSCQPNSAINRNQMNKTSNNYFKSNQNSKWE